MRTFLPFVAASFLISGCAATDPAPVRASGDLQARYVDNVDQVGIGGSLVTNGIAFEPCEAPTINAEPATFEFSGNEGAVDIELPEGELCGIRIVVLDLTIEAEDNGVSKTVVGQDFDFWIPGEAIPTEGGLVLQLGHDTWLQEFLPLAGEGTTLLNDEADEDLLVSFYDGLHQGSSLDAQNTVVEQNEADGEE